MIDEGRTRAEREAVAEAVELEGVGRVDLFTRAGLVRVGFGHASIRGMLAGRSREVRTTITSEPCDCPDAHVEVYVRDAKAR